MPSFMHTMPCDPILSKKKKCHVTPCSRSACTPRDFISTLTCSISDCYELQTAGWALASLYAYKEAAKISVLVFLCVCARARA